MEHKKSWQEKVIEIVREHHKENNQNDDKRRIYIIEDEYRVKFVELADDIINEDVFVEKKDLDVLNKVKKKRGRPKRKLYIDILDTPKELKKEPKKVGRPRVENFEYEDGDNRQYKYCVNYLKTRYKNDPEFKEERKKYGREYYHRKKEEAKLLNKIKEDSDKPVE